MGLFDKKNCDFCGNKIGLLGNKKLEDGNMCKECASKLSPWFSERRHSTKAEIQTQLDYREENKKAVAAFHTTRSIGRYTKLLLDEDQQKFMVTGASKLEAANPDVLDFKQVTGCNLCIDESRHELKHEGEDGKQISYDPPQYDYSYNFRVNIQVNHPFFDDISYSLSNGSVKTGEQPAAAVPEGWQFNSAQTVDPKLNNYYEYLRMGNEIRDTLERMRLGLPTVVEPEPVPVPDADAAMVTCPWCGSLTLLDDNSCCASCGGFLNI